MDFFLKPRKHSVSEYRNSPIVKKKMFLFPSRIFFRKLYMMFKLEFKIKGNLSLNAINFRKEYRILIHH